MSDPFLAEIRIFGFSSFAPMGWAFCDGQLMNIQQNPALFALIGTTYGGDGQTNFKLPDLQGRTPMNPGTGPGMTPRTLGQTGGDETVTLNDATMPSHNHQLMAGGTGASTDPNGAFPSGQRSGSFYRNSTNLVPMATQAIQPPSGSGSLQHTNMQPYISLSFCIAVEGVWPDRP